MSEQALWETEIKSESSSRKYTVSMKPSGELTCTCPDFLYRRNICKHIRMTELTNKAKLAEVRSRRPSRYFSRKEIYGLYIWLRAKLGPHVRLEMGGSFRRGKEHVRDLDLLAYTQYRNRFQLILAKAYPAGCLVSGPKQIRWEIPINPKDKMSRKIQIDIYFTSAAHYEAMLMHLTGGAEFNIDMRRRAKAQGLLLNQYGLWTRAEKVEDRVFVTGTEKGIFKKLGIKYLAPEERP